MENTREISFFFVLCRFIKERRRASYFSRALTQLRDRVSLRKIALYLARVFLLIFFPSINIRKNLKKELII